MLLACAATLSNIGDDVDGLRTAAPHLRADYRHAALHVNVAHVLAFIHLRTTSGLGNYHEHIAGDTTGKRLV